MIDAGKFAKPLIDQADTAGKTFSFGMTTPAAMALVLHEFANAVGNGDVVLQEVQTGSIAVPDDYHLSALFISFAVRVKPQE